MTDDATRRVMLAELRAAGVEVGDVEYGRGMTSAEITDAYDQLQETEHGMFMLDHLPDVAMVIGEVFPQLAPEQRDVISGLCAISFIQGWLHGGREGAL